MVKLEPDNPFGPSPSESSAEKALLIFGNQSDRRIKLLPITANGTTDEDHSKSVGPDRVAFIDSCIGCVWRVHDDITQKTLKHIQVQSPMYNLKFNITEECIERPTQDDEESVQQILAMMAVGVEDDNKRCSNLPLSVVSDLDCEIFYEQNRLRSNPKAVVPYLQRRFNHLTALENNPHAQQIVSYEGTEAVVEALEFAEKAKPLPRLEWSDGLFLAAQEHCLDVGSLGSVSHFGSNGSNPFQRMKQHGEPIGSFGENIAYGASRAKDIVMKLFIDDGVKSRGNRKSIMNKSLQLTGVATCTHKKYNTMSVITYTNEFVINQSGKDQIKNLMDASKPPSPKGTEVITEPKVTIVSMNKPKEAVVSPVHKHKDKEPAPAPKIMISQELPKEAVVAPNHNHPHDNEPAPAPKIMIQGPSHVMHSGHKQPKKDEKITEMLVIKPTQAPPVQDYLKMTQFATKLEWEIFNVQNQLRADPRSFLPHLQKRLEQFQGDQMFLSATRTQSKKKNDYGLTQEGSSAVYEAISFIQKYRPHLKPLQWSDGLAVAAYDHCKDASKKGSDGNFWLDITSSVDRLSRYGTVRGFTAENMIYGKNLAIDIILDLLIDDGSWNRGHRRNMLSPAFVETGVAFCLHGSQLKYLTNIYYAEDFFVDKRGLKRIEQVSQLRQRIEYSEPKPEPSLIKIEEVVPKPAHTSGGGHLHDKEPSPSPMKPFKPSSHSGHHTQSKSITATPWTEFKAGKSGNAKPHWMIGKFRTFSDSGQLNMEFVTTLHANVKKSLQNNYLYQAWVLFKGRESISCTIKFITKDRNTVIHQNIPVDSPRIVLNQWCNSTYSVLRQNCTSWERSTCEDTGDCMHNHRDKKVKSYMRCGVKRTLKSERNAINIGDELSFKAGFNVYDDNGVLKNWGEMQQWDTMIVKAPLGWKPPSSSPRVWNDKGPRNSGWTYQNGKWLGPNQIGLAPVLPKDAVIPKEAGLTPHQHYGNGLINPEESSPRKPTPVVITPLIPLRKNGQKTLPRPPIVLPVSRTQHRRRQDPQPRMPSFPIAKHDHTLPLMPTFGKRTKRRRFLPPKLIEPATLTMRESKSRFATQLEWDIFTVQNKLRTNPLGLVPYLRKQLISFNGKWLMDGPKGIPIRTKEGPKAWEEAIRELTLQKAVKPLKWSDALSLAAHDHCKDIGKKKIIGHKGSDGSLPWDRIKRYGVPQGHLAENIAYGSETAMDIVMMLYVDDGEDQRGHRWNMMADAYNKTGLAFCKHKSTKIKYMVDLLYAQKFKPNQRGKDAIQVMNKIVRPVAPVVPPQEGSKPTGISGRKKYSNSAWASGQVVTRRKRPNKPIIKRVKPVVPKVTRTNIMYPLIAKFPTKLEVAVFNTINLLRTKPNNFIGYLTDQLLRFKGNTIQYQDQNRVDIMTQEGPAVWEEAIAVLKQLRPMKPLAWSDGLALAAQDHCADHGVNGMIGHVGSDNSSPWSRISKYGQAYGYQGENTVYGAQTALEIVMKQFVDDGEKGRGHRRNLLNPYYKISGVAFCRHSKLDWMTDIKLVNQFHQSRKATNLATYLRKRKWTPTPVQREPITIVMPTVVVPAVPSIVQVVPVVAPSPRPRPIIVTPLSPLPRPIIVTPLSPRPRPIIVTPLPPLPPRRIINEKKPSLPPNHMEWTKVENIPEIVNTTAAKPIIIPNEPTLNLTTDEAMKGLFQFFDNDKNGDVSRDELKYVFLKKLDTNGDYSVSPLELFKGTVQYLEKICQSTPFKQTVYSEDVAEDYLALGVIDWRDHDGNYQKCLNRVNLYQGPLKHEECKKWVGFNPLSAHKEFKSRYSLFKFLDLDDNGFLSEEEFVDRTTNLIKESSDHYSYFKIQIELYGLQFCKDPRIRPFETAQKLCEKNELKKRAIQIAMGGPDVLKKVKLSIAKKCASKV